MLEEYWAEGGTIQWIAQSASEREDYAKNIGTAAERGARGVYLHGGVVDVYHQKGETGHFRTALEKARAVGLAAGFAAHNVGPHQWINDNLSPDFHMCCYYDPTPRTSSPHHVVSNDEVFDPCHRDEMTRFIGKLKAPAVHYKVLAAGRTPAKDAFEYAAPFIRPQDVVLVGFYLGDDEDLITRTVDLFTRIVRC